MISSHHALVDYLSYLINSYRDCLLEDVFRMLVILRNQISSRLQEALSDGNLKETNILNN